MIRNRRVEYVLVHTYCNNTSRHHLADAVTGRNIYRADAHSRLTTGAIKSLH